MSRSFAAVGAFLVLVSSVSAAPLWHFTMLRSVPAKDQTLAVAPTRLQIWFSEAPAAGVSKLTLLRADKAVALKPLVLTASDKSIYADPVKPLDAGSYTLNWRTAGDDGHVMSGELKFTIEPKPHP
jgi:copper resistance protein C